MTDLVLNESNNTLTAATYGRSMFQIFLDTTQAGGGSLTEPSGSSVWTGRVFLSGPTTFGASGTQALRNGLAAAQLTLIGTIADLVPNADNYVTKTGLGNVVFSAPTPTAASPRSSRAHWSSTTRRRWAGRPTGPSSIAAPRCSSTSSVNGEPLTLNGIGPVPGFDGHSTGALENVSNNNTYTGPITLAGDSTIGVDSGSTLTIPGAIGDGGGGYSVTKELTGTLVLQAANTYGGNTLVNQGILNIQNSNALGSGAATTFGTEVLDGAQLQLQGGLDVTGEALRISGTGIFNTGAVESVGGANTWDGSVTLARGPASRRRPRRRTPWASAC